MKNPTLKERIKLTAFGLLVLSIAIACAEDTTVSGFRDEFDSLENWRPLLFKKIKRHTTYATERAPDGVQRLKAQTHGSASGLICKQTFNPYQTPVLSWRWRVENIFQKGNATRKDGDDYPLRIYVLFHYDPKRSSATQKLKYALAKRIHGEYPPDSVLNYIWASREHEKRIISSPYTKRSQMVIVKAGASKTGTWLDEEVNILDDYRIAFSSDPPARATLAIMSDSDNTGEAAVAYLDYIRLRPEEAKDRSATEGGDGS